MYYDTCTFQRDGHTYRRELLRESFRVAGKGHKRTIANISDWPDPVKLAIRQALAGQRTKGATASLSAVVASQPRCTIQQGQSVGALAVLLQTAQACHVTAALGDGRAAKLALWQVLARTLDQGSRLSATRLARQLPVPELLGLDPFSEHDLYANLDWLAAQQVLIEDRLWQARYRPGERPALFLYDVTSTYLEGTENALAAFGYNRDGKHGKRQLVIGLLCDQHGWPLTIEVFTGNTSDPTTVASQVAKLATRFGGGEITLVGDRGMLKTRQCADLLGRGMHYLTAITKAQIQTLLQRGTLQLELFEQELAEVVTADDGRYVVRRNPVQADRQAARRADQLATWERQLAKENAYLAAHPRAAVATAIARLQKRAAGLKLDSWLSVSASGRTLTAHHDAAARQAAAQLDGCYVLHTDLTIAQADKATLDARYHDLSKVEWAFRTCKTTALEMRPVHVRTADHTRAHALVVMLAYHLQHHLAACWQALDCTVAEGLTELRELCVMELHFPNQTVVYELPRPRPSSAALLAAAHVTLPTLLPRGRPGVDTTRKLPSRRKSR